MRTDYKGIGTTILGAGFAAITQLADKDSWYLPLLWLIAAFLIFAGVIVVTWPYLKEHVYPDFSPKDQISASHDTVWLADAVYFLVHDHWPTSGNAIHRPNTLEPYDEVAGQKLLASSQQILRNIQQYGHDGVIDIFGKLRRSSLCLDGNVSRYGIMVKIPKEHWKNHSVNISQFVNDACYIHTAKDGSFPDEESFVALKTIKNQIVDNRHLLRRDPLFGSSHSPTN